MGPDTIEYTCYRISQCSFYFTDFVCGVSESGANKKEYTFGTQSPDFSCQRIGHPAAYMNPLSCRQAQRGIISRKH
jgi:hypothetical protein